MRTLAIALASLSLAIAADPPKTYTGTITDSMCVMNHKMMNITPDSKCARECVKKSKEVKYVLHQKTPEDFAAPEAREPVPLSASHHHAVGR